MHPKITLLFSKIFTEIIKEKMKNSGYKKVFLFSPSHEGKIYALWTGLLLKADKIDITFDFNEYDENAFKVAMDISKDTGFTLAYRWAVEMSKKEYEKDKKVINYNIYKIINNNIDNFLNKEFNLILTIMERNMEEKGKMDFNREILQFIK